MTNDTDNRDQVIAELQRATDWYYRRYRTGRALQWVLTAAIAAAGILTTMAVAPFAQEISWVSSPGARVAWGLVAAIGAGARQVATPGADSEMNLTIKLVLKDVKRNLKYGYISAQDALRFHLIAERDPDRAANELEEILDSVKKS